MFCIASIFMKYCCKTGSWQSFQLLCSKNKKTPQVRGRGLTPATMALTFDLGHFWHHLQPRGLLIVKTHTSNLSSQIVPFLRGKYSHVNVPL